MLRLILTLLLTLIPIALHAEEGGRVVALDRWLTKVPQDWHLAPQGAGWAYRPDARSALGGPQVAVLPEALETVLGGDSGASTTLDLAVGKLTVVAVDGRGWFAALDKDRTLALTAPVEGWAEALPVFEEALAALAPGAEAPLPVLDGLWLSGPEAVRLVAQDGGAWWRGGSPQGGVEVVRLDAATLRMVVGPGGDGVLAADGLAIDWQDGGRWQRPVTAGGWQAKGAPRVIALETLGAVWNGPEAASGFRLTKAARLDLLTTYHWNDGQGAPPGEIGLTGPQGALGPWPASGLPGQGGVANATWQVAPGVVLPPGDYTVTDSDPATWATNDDTARRGIFAATVQPVVAGQGVLFDGVVAPLWRPLSAAGGNFDSFARLEGGTLRVDVPPGNAWGKTGLWSATPLFDLRGGAAGLGFDLDPEGTDSFVLSFSEREDPEEWSGHLFRFHWARSADGASGLAQIVVRQAVAAQVVTGPEAPARVEVHADPVGTVSFTLPEGRRVEARVDSAILQRQPLFVQALAHAPDVNQPVRFALRRIEALPGRAEVLPHWPGPDSAVLFSDSLAPNWVGHNAGGTRFDAVAQVGSDGLVVDVPPESGWGMAGLLSPEPLVWLDDFGPGAEVRLTFRLDPARTDGFVIALAHPGWGGVAGNGPGVPGVSFSWVRPAAGGAPVAEFHVQPHREGDFDRREMPGDPPGDLTLILRPGEVELTAPGMEPFRRDFPMAQPGVGFRVYAYSATDTAGAPTRFALRDITLTRPARVPLPKALPQQGVEPLAMKTIFDGTESANWEPAAVAGGDFAAFARYADGALRVEVPAGNSWGKTGLLSAGPVVRTDARMWRVPTRIEVQLDPSAPQNMVVALSHSKTAEMWPDHIGWFTFSYIAARDSWLMGLHVSPYNDWSREVPAAWMARHWDGRLWIDLGPDWGAIEVPGGPRLRAAAAFAPWIAPHATIIAHAPREGEAARLVLRRVSVGLATPPGLDALTRWLLLEPQDFDPDAYLSDLAARLPGGALPAMED